MPDDTGAPHVLARIDALIGPAGPAGPRVPDGVLALGALARRAARSAPPPPGEILVPAVEPGGEWTPRPVQPTEGLDRRGQNMGPPAVRIDHWDAYVCRFDDGDDDAGPDRPLL